jgi:hypothetical protein
VTVAALQGSAGIGTLAGRLLRRTAVFAAVYVLECLIRLALDLLSAMRFDLVTCSPPAVPA